MKVEIAALRTVPTLHPLGLDPTQDSDELMEAWSRPWELFSFPKAYVELAGEHVSWSNRPKVTFDVEEQGDVDDALAAAAHALGVTWTPGAERFFGGMGGFGYRLRNLHLGVGDRTFEPILFVLEESGRISYHVHYDELRFTDLIRLSEAGLTAADPTRIALLLDPYPAQPEGGGGNGFTLWGNVIQIYDSVLPYLDDVGVIYAASQAARGSYTRVSQALRRRIPSLERRHVGLAQVIALSRLVKEQKKLARLIGLSEKETFDLLVTLGLIRDPSQDGSLDGAMRRRIRLACQVSTDFHLNRDELGEAVKRCLMVPEGDEAAMEATMRKIFTQFQGW